MILSLFEVVSGVGDCLDWLGAGVAGWRYLLSSAYRRKMHIRWRLTGKARASLEVLGGLSGVALTLLMAGVVICLIAGS